MFGSLDSFTIMAIPLFMLAGNLMSSGGISRRLVNFCNAILGWLPGGLGVVAIFACMLFGALSGSPTATCAAIGSIMVPSMIEAGYSKRFSLGTVAVAGILGCIIPPSTVMVSYSSVTDASVGSMFMGGIIPGILMGIAMMIIPIQYGVKHKEEVQRTKFSLRNLGRSTVEAIGALLMPVIILAIARTVGDDSLDEVLRRIQMDFAGVACAYGLIVGLFIYRALKLRELKAVILGSASSTGMVLFIMACAAVFGYVMARYQMTNAIAEFIISLCPNKYVFLLLVNILLLIVGCFMETTAAILILAPIFAPILTVFGISPVHSSAHCRKLRCGPHPLRPYDVPEYLHRLLHAASGPEPVRGGRPDKGQGGGCGQQAYGGLHPALHRHPLPHYLRPGSGHAPAQLHDVMSAGRQASWPSAPHERKESLCLN